MSSRTLLRDVILIMQLDKCKLLNAPRNMYEYPMKTLVEGGRVKEKEAPLKKDWSYIPLKQMVE